MRFIASSSRVLGTTLFAIALALVLFLIILSNGRVLDLRIGAAAEGPTLPAIALFCWAILLAFGVQLTVGGWKHHRGLKRSVLMVLLLLPLLIVIPSVLPDATPDWVGAVLAGFSALVACVIAELVVPRR